MAAIVGLTGYAQHGKNSVADILERDYGFKQVAFADALRALATVVNPYVISDAQKPNRYEGVVRQVGYEQAKTIGDTRRFLQQLGVGVRDVIGEDAWVDALFKDLNLLDDIVITDVRFWNEALAVYDERGEMWGVVRTNADGTLYDNGIGADHPSEAVVADLVQDADYVLRASNLDELEAAVHAIMDGDVNG